MKSLPWIVRWAIYLVCACILIGFIITGISICAGVFFLGSSDETIPSPPSPKPSTPSPAPGETTQLASIGDTIPVPHKENLSVTLLWWKESKVAVHGAYGDGEYYTFTAKPGMKFIILAYEFNNSWLREQETPYLSGGTGEILTAPQGYYFELWDPPLGVSSEEYKPRRATAEEIETLIGDSGGYEKLMPEQSVVGCIKFEIPKDATPVEADIIGLRPYLVKF